MPTGPSNAQFPYMFWAQSESFLSPYCLSQSGMPAPDPAVFASPRLPDLGPPTAEAIPALETRLGELFGVPRERVLIVPGASGAMFLAAMRAFPGARVVTELPSYEPFRALPGRFAADVRLVQRRHEDGWRLPLDDVARELAGHTPAHVFLSSPHNPTGHVLTADEVRAIARMAEASGGLCILNETYMEFAPPDGRVHAFRLAPNTISIGSLTKAYGLGPLRIGWMILGEGLAEQREHFLDQAYLAWIDPPTTVVRFALDALDNLEALLQPVRRYEHESRPLLERFLRDSDLVEGHVGPYGISCFPKVLGVRDTHALQKHLAREVGVDVVPGEFFGAAGHVRMSFAVPQATLEEALQRLERGIRSFRAG